MQLEEEFSMNIFNFKQAIEIVSNFTVSSIIPSGKSISKI
jgi:hypothetical protein